MSDVLVELFRQASELPEEDRATLAGLLIESLESEYHTEVDEAWAVERRVAELESGRVKGIPWEEVRAKLLGRRGGS